MNELLQNIEIPKNIKIPQNNALVSYIIIIGCALLALFVVSCIIKFVVRIFFSKIKFAICMFIAASLFSFLTKTFAQSPIVATTNNSHTNDVLEQAATSFKGIYSAKNPLLAYKFAPSQTATGSKNGNNVRINVSYLPYGNVELEYNPVTKGFKIVKPLS